MGRVILISILSFSSLFCYEPTPYQQIEIFLNYRIDEKLDLLVESEDGSFEEMYIYGQIMAYYDTLKFIQFIEE